MKRTALVGTVVFTAMMCMAQMGPHSQAGGDASGSISSSRTEFGSSCGIQDTSVESALQVTRSDEGEWTALAAGRNPGMRESAVARIWRESNWMVDLHGALGQGMANMHTGQMCFDPQGHITHMLDRYMEMATCGCVRFTSLSYDKDGRVTRREQRFISATTGAKIEAPEVAKGFPEVWDFRRLDQLPFYSLLKK